MKPEPDMKNNAKPRPGDSGVGAEVMVGLRREIGLMSAVGLIISAIIGSGIFMTPAAVLGYSGSVGLSLVVWASCGLLSYLGALCYGEMGCVVGDSGAEYAYLQATFGQMGSSLWGPLPGFLCVWIHVLAVTPADAAILLLTCAEYLYRPLAEAAGVTLTADQSYWLVKSLALIALATITCINFLSVKLYLRVQNTFSSLKILACAVIISGGVYYLCLGNTQNISKGFENTKTSPKDIALAFYGGLFAYGGWSAVNMVAEETKSPQRNIPLSISIAVPFITVIYLLMNVSYMSVLTANEMISSTVVASTFAEKIFGSFGYIVPAIVVVSTFGCALTLQFQVSRLCYVAARNGHMLEFLSYIHVKRMTPAPAVLFQAILATFLILSGNIIKLIEFASFFTWIFFGLSMVTLMILRKTRKDAYRPYKVPLAVPVLVLLLSIYITVVPLVFEPSPHMLVAVGFMLLGFIVYYPFVYKEYHPFFMVKISRIIKSALNVAPPNYQEQTSKENIAQNGDINEHGSKDEQFEKPTKALEERCDSHQTKF